MLNRADVVTPAIIDEAVSGAADRCMRKSHRAGRLIGLDAADIVGYLDRHFASLARNLRPHNVAEYATDWFERDRPTIADVVPLAARRHPVPLLDTPPLSDRLTSPST
jgi:hypothetical protein